MTIREYIIAKLPAFSLTDADFIDLSVDVNETYSTKNSKEVNIAMITLIEELAFRPHLKNINESGFSANWEYDLANYYRLLCTKYDVEMNADVCSILGISTIVFADLSDYLN